MTVKIVTDSSCDLPDGLVSELGIDVVPLTIRFGAEELVDRRDLSPSEFWARCATTAELPSTAAPAPGAFEEVFRAAAAAGAEGVMCVVLSSKLSATGESAQAAARAVADVVPVTVVDSLSVSLGHGMMAVQGARRAAAGAPLDEIVAMAEDMARRTKIFATLDTLEYLKRGGRIGAAQALLGSILSIKPCIEVVDGKVEPGPKQRTRSRSLQWLADQVGAQKNVENLAVLHGDAPDVDTLLGLLDPHFPRDQIVIGQLGAVVGTHTGPRTIGVAFQTAAGAGTVS
ncbi:MAG: DegV family protein [uncultured Acidimicrobiales bacterium]|uniref:DegV family protein n=1 Tax=uncultured Acidimicrobiales bacterium TaxID=310071 RepID=A0A6J4H576_9ACTN|nr:MAG: DegV family protein [uncultured Acidimicrobiales bacterium]